MPHPCELRLTRQELQECLDACLQPRLCGRLSQVGTLDMPDHLVQPGIIGQSIASRTQWAAW
jgi:hypothetical protein